MPQRRRLDHGFTLLEVMVAMAILAVGLTVLAETQHAGMRQVLRAKLMTVATMLAREKMVEVEDELFKEGFSDFDEEQRGDFEDEGFERFSYLLKVEKVELPAAIDPSALEGALGGEQLDDAAGSSASAGGGMAALGAGMLANILPMIRNMLEESIRRVSLEVSWKEGSTARSITVTGYFTDPRHIGSLGSMGSAVPPASSSAGSTSRTSGAAR